MSSSETAHELLLNRNACWEALDEYFLKNYPFSEEQYQEYRELSVAVTNAEQMFMERCNPSWRPPHG